MLMRHLTLALLGTVLVSAPAVAQTSPPAAPTTAPSAQTQTMNTATWMTQMQPGQWRASQLRGLSVYNTNNERIGEIDELLVDNSGKIQAAVIGVGGFLGIGEHRVAVPLDQMTFVNEPRAVATTAVPPTAPAGPATTGTVTTDARRTAPDHAVLMGGMTKEQLKAAPEFNYAR